MNASERSSRNRITTTVLPVHGHFADASSWAGIIPVLLAAGMDLIAPANPPRGLTADGAYIACVMGEIDGPVLLVGHAYGGAVITVVGAQAGNVVGLVYLTGYALEEGECAIDINRCFPSSHFGPALRPATSANGGYALGVELYIKHDAFAAVRAAAALEEPCRPAAWKTLPLWFMVATADQVIHPDAQRFMARRAGAQTVEGDASHAIALSQPAAVADLIRCAASAGHPSPAHTTEEDSRSATR